MSVAATIAIIGAIFAGLSALDINIGDTVRIRGAVMSLNENRVKELESRVQTLVAKKAEGTLNDDEVQALQAELSSIVENSTTKATAKTSHFSKGE